MASTTIHSSRSGAAATIVVTSVAAFMVALDNLVVTTALPSIRAHLHSGLEGLEWTVNAYTLTFAVLLLPAAALGDRLGRRRVFLSGLALFTVASAAAALSRSTGMLVTARALQGVGGAAVMPLSLTLLQASVPAHRRGAALGVWGAASGLAVALGPVVGGAVTQGASWEFIFWLNVPIGLVLIPFARRALPEMVAPTARLDLPGLLLISGGLFAIVFGIVRGGGHGWTSQQVLGSLAAGAVLVGAFVLREAHTDAPMLPLHLFRSRGFGAVNITALLMSFGMFGSVFLLSQYLQTAMGYSPLGAGLRTLPWTAMPVLVAPIAGPLSDRIGGRPLLIAGLALQTAGLGWILLTIHSGVAYPSLIPAFVLSGIGMGLFFVPVAAVVFGSVAPSAAGVASGTNNSFRELGGTLGVAVLGSVFSAAGSLGSPEQFVDGLRPALVVGTAVLALGTVTALLLPRGRPVVQDEPEQRDEDVALPVQLAAA
jgi:EmrB/QacA subfamily drug resistance transporter